MTTPPRVDQQIDPPPSVLAPGGAAGIFRGRLVIVNGVVPPGGGIFIYSGGNLVGYWVGSAGTDPVNGSAVQQGLSVQLSSLDKTPTRLTALAVIAPTVETYNPTLSDGTLEAWHTLSLAAGWSTVAGQPVPSYRLLPDGNIQIVGSATHTAFSTPTNLSTAGALPAAYQPMNTQFVSGGISTDASIEITTAGTVVAQPGGASLTSCRFGGTYPVNL